MAQKGSFFDTIGKLFQSPEQKERAKIDRQRRITYLKRKYGGESFRPKRSRDRGDDIE
jgi:hypothetical protein